MRDRPTATDRRVGLILLSSRRRPDDFHLSSGLLRLRANFNIVRTIPVSYSDHRLVKVTLDCARPVASRVTYNYRDFRRMNVCAFTSYLRQTVSISGTSSHVDESVHQLEQDITRGLDQLALVRVKTKRLGRLGNKWVTTEANEDKQERRRLKRRYLRTRSPADKLVYRCACRKASALINSSRSAHLRNEVEQATGQPRMLWKAVRRLLQPGPSASWYKGLDTEALATGLCNFFVDKVKQVKVKVEHSLHGAPNDNRLTELTLIKPQRSLKSFACFTASEIERLIKSAPMKTSQ